MARFLSACALYLTPRLSDRRLCRDPERLERLLRARFHQNGREAPPEAARLLTEALLSPRLAQGRSLTVLERVVEEVVEAGAADGAETMRNYLNRTDTLVALLAGEASKARGGDDETAALHL